MEKAKKKNALYFTYMNKVDTIWSMFIRLLSLGLLKKLIYIYMIYYIGGGGGG